MRLLSTRKFINQKADFVMRNIESEDNIKSELESLILELKLIRKCSDMSLQALADS